jgi:hypothetical protein
VRDLFANGWLSLMSMDGAGRVTERFTPGGWEAVHLPMRCRHVNRTDRQG